MTEDGEAFVQPLPLSGRVWSILSLEESVYPTSMDIYFFLNHVLWLLLDLKSVISGNHVWASDKFALVLRKSPSCHTGPSSGFFAMFRVR